MSDDLFVKISRWLSREFRFSRFKDYFSFAWTNLTHRKIRSWLTLLGIFIGVMAVVSLISLGDGLKAAVSAQFGISTTEVITIQAGGFTGAGPPGIGVVNPLTTKDSDDLAALTVAERSVPRIIEQGKLVFNDRAVFGLAASIPYGDDRKFVYDVLDIEAEDGRLLKDGDNKKVLLGYNFGADLVDLGEPVRVGDTVEVKDVKFEVVGISKKKGSFIFDNMVLVNEDPLKELMDDPDRVDAIVVQVKDKDLMAKAAEDISEVLRKNRDVKKGEEDFIVQTPEAALSVVNDILTGIQVFIVLIAFISIIVGALGIVNTMTTSVLERRSQIGVMKAIGAKNFDIFIQFLFESGLMGLLGGAVGIIIGELLAFGGTQGINAFIGSETPFRINLVLIFGALLGSFLIGSIAGIVPAMNAARENPVDALRG